MDPLEQFEQTVTSELGVDMTVVENQGTLVLMEIERTSGAPGSGRLAMERLCAYADEAGLPVQLAILGHERKLQDLYESLGFEVIAPEGEDDGGTNMRRPAQAPAPGIGFAP